MKKNRFNEHQIMQILKQAEGGVPVPELCRQHGMSSASFYKWRAKCGGMDASMIAEMKALVEENKRLKRMYAESQMECEIIKEAMAQWAVNNRQISVRMACKAFGVSECCYRYQPIRND